MNNALFHHPEVISQMRADVGAKLVYLSPYSPDLNPIEEFFAELKDFIGRNWTCYAEDPDREFGLFHDGVLIRLRQEKTVSVAIFGMQVLSIEDLKIGYVRRR
jgi:transposase